MKEPSTSSASDVLRLLEAAGFRPDERGIYRSGEGGYWSNLDREENSAFLERAEQGTVLDAVRETIPHLEGMIFSPKREGSLELLGPKVGDVCLDYGCMWGVLSVGMALRGATVVSVDQTYDSLRFLAARIRQDGLERIVPVQADIRTIDLPPVADVAILNGVLEWVPEFGQVELKQFYGRRMARAYPSDSPREIQRKLLERIRGQLKPGGRLMLAIENRYDYAQFIGRRDPHTNLWFTSVLPRTLSNMVSRLAVGRPYVNYLYSFRALERLLRDAGFAAVDLHMVFPNYRFPELILPYPHGIREYRIHWSGSLTLRRKFAFGAEYALMRFLRGAFFAPSIIAIATR